VDPGGTNDLDATAQAWLDSANAALDDVKQRASGNPVTGVLAPGMASAWVDSVGGFFGTIEWMSPTAEDHPMKYVASQRIHKVASGLKSYAETNQAALRKTGQMPPARPKFMPPNLGEKSVDGAVMMGHVTFIAATIIVPELLAEVGPALLAPRAVEVGSEAGVLAGSGGGLRYISSNPSSRIVSQELNMSCGPACARQLLADVGVQVAEAELRGGMTATTQFGMSSERVAQALTKLHPEATFRGGGVGPGSLDALMETGPFIARLKPNSGPHFVIVDGAEAGGALRIRDPWGPASPGSGQGLEGLMSREVFMESWQKGVFNVVFKSGPK
jgi:predicted double-glycine peptidase